MLDDPQYLIWREKIAPLIYDWFAHHNLPWPTQACRFGSLVEELTYKSRYRIYYSEQTDDSEPQKLIVATADVCKPGVASAEVVSSWTDFSKSPYLKEQKVIFHPGEVNKIREVPAHPQLVVTHTDAPEVNVWNVDKQPHRNRNVKTGKGAAPSVPDLQLTGHEDEALFPLATTAAGPSVASGGNDCLVLVWSLDDHEDNLLAGGGGGSVGAKQAPTLAARSRLEGHTKTVEEVVFKPGSVQELASVGDDFQLLFWDCRAGKAPVRHMANAHGANQDVQCVDWSGLSEHCVATGAQDGSVKVWDVRALRGCDDTLATLRCHTDAIIRLEWHPSAKGVLASGGDDKVVMLWRIDPDGAPQLPGGSGDRAATLRARHKGGAPLPGAKQRPSELIMQHSGHRRGKVVDFQWCPHVSWAIMSVSDDSADEDVGGGSLQMWRPSELLYGDEAKLLEQLEKHRDWIINGRNPPPPPAPLLVEHTKEELEAQTAAKAAAVARSQAAREREGRKAEARAADGGSAGKGGRRASGRAGAGKGEEAGDEEAAVVAAGEGQEEAGAAAAEEEEVAKAPDEGLGAEAAAVPVAMEEEGALAVDDAGLGAADVDMAIANAAAAAAAVLESSGDLEIPHVLDSMVE